MKKRIIILIILAIVLLTPYPIQYKDGGSVEFRALIYSVTKIHSLETNSNSTREYVEGIEIEILGFKVYSNVEC